MSAMVQDLSNDECATEMDDDLVRELVTGSVAAQMVAHERDRKTRKETMTYDFHMPDGRQIRVSRSYIV